MSNNPVSLEFLQGRVEHLEHALNELALHEYSLARKLGSERVSELKAFWDQNLEAEEVHDFKTGLDARDLQMLWVWIRLERTHSDRVKTGQYIMRHYRVAESP